MFDGYLKRIFTRNTRLFKLSNIINENTEFAKGLLKADLIIKGQTCDGEKNVLIIEFKEKATLTAVAQVLAYRSLYIWQRLKNFEEYKKVIPIVIQIKKGKLDKECKFFEVPVKIISLEEVSNTFKPETIDDYLYLVFSKRGRKKILENIQIIKDPIIIEDLAIGFIIFEPQKVKNIMSVLEDVKHEYSKDFIEYIIDHVGVKETVDAVGIKRVVDAVGIKKLLDELTLSEIMNRIEKDLKDGKLTKKDLIKIGRQLSELSARILDLAD